MVYIPASATAIVPAVTDAGSTPAEDAANEGIGGFFSGLLETAGQIGTNLLAFDLQKDILRDQLAITQLEQQIQQAEADARNTTNANAVATSPSFVEKYEKWIVGGVGLVAAFAIAKAAKLI